MTDLLLLATEGVEGLSPDHIASKLAVPIGIVIFCGAVFCLLWSNYGAKKGGLIYGVALFGFSFVIGIFWWLGAPGTPVATGPQNFPGQAADAYQPKWYPFEAGSPRSEFYSLWRNIDDFQTLEEFVGTDDDTDPYYTAVSGDLDAVTGVMIEQYFPRENGSLQIGASFRERLQSAVSEIENPDGRFEDFVTEIAGTSPDSQFGAEDQQLFIGLDNGQRVAAAVLETYAVFVDPDTDLETQRVSIATENWFAVKDPGAIWLPSVVWVVVSLVLFALCLLGLDRVEQREKREDIEVEEAMDVQVPIAQ